MLDHKYTHPQVPSFLEALKLASGNRESAATQEVSVNLITNFTDDVFKKLLSGLLRSVALEPNLYSVPYKQYLFALKDEQAELYTRQAKATFIFFDINPYKQSEFHHQKQHVETVIADIERYCSVATETVVLITAPTPLDIQYQRTLVHEELLQMIATYNESLREIARRYSAVHIIECDPIIARIGQSQTYDMRGLFAFDQPFTNDFLYQVAIECFAFMRSISGIVRKCIVVDLDNTLWGKVVGEEGPLGIALGPEYPGNAYVAFQQVLKQFYENGIILAINSRNNRADVDEVFEKNTNMVLQQSHFGSIVCNWHTKAENLRLIAQELNIGLDSMVFLDDDAMNRDMVRAQVPEVLVPEFSMAPEFYVQTLLNLESFHSLSQTAEDKERGKMYAAERNRREALASAPSKAEYLASLAVTVALSLNEISAIPRLAQMTQKTNQFNLTTKRQTEQDLEAVIATGGYVFSGNVTDSFGEYGLTILAIVIPTGSDSCVIDTLLMSCRVMGRNVEHAFLAEVLKFLKEKGFSSVSASFIKTAKNAPAEAFLAEVGGIRELNTEIPHYALDYDAVSATVSEQCLPTVIFNHE
jgi:FkbH-like protein